MSAKLISFADATVVRNNLIFTNISISSRIKFTVAVLTFISVMILPGCASNPVTEESDLVFMSEEEEINLGRNLSKKLPKKFGGIYQDESIAEYVSSIGEKLAMQSHRADLIYHFYVLDSPDINAFALPGGYIYITRGMLARFNSQGELAAVLAHELGHVTARHGVTRHSKGVMVSLIGNVLLQTTGARGQAWSQAQQVVSQAIMSGYSRSDEHQADTLAVEYLSKAGYNPNKMLNVLKALKSQDEYRKKIANKENKSIPLYHKVFSTHPENEVRIEKVISKSKEFADTGEDIKEDYLKKIEGIVYGQSEEEGIVRNSTLYHPKLKVVVPFPKGWKVKNTNDYIEAYAPDDTSLIRLTLRDKNRRESETKHIKRYLESHDLKDIQPLNGEFGGVIALAKVKTRYGNKVSRIGAIFKDKLIYEFTAVSKTDSEFEKNDRLFIKTMTNFHSIKTEQEIKMAQPERIKLFTAKVGDTVEKIVKELKLDKRMIDIIRLLNGLYPTDEPQAGDLIKVVR